MSRGIGRREGKEVLKIGAADMKNNRDFLDGAGSCLIKGCEVGGVFDEVDDVLEAGCNVELGAVVLVGEERVIQAG